MQRPFPSFLIYVDAQGHWRWNFAAPNGKVIASSTVAYTAKEGCRRAIQLLNQAQDVPVLVGRRGQAPVEATDSQQAVEDLEPETVEAKAE